MNDELLSEYGCMDCIHDDEEEDHTESCYVCSWFMGEGKGYPCLFQPKDEPAIAIMVGNSIATMVRNSIQIERNQKEEDLCGMGGLDPVWTGHHCGYCNWHDDIHCTGLIGGNHHEME